MNVVYIFAGNRTECLALLMAANHVTKNLHSELFSACDSGNTTISSTLTWMCTKGVTIKTLAFIHASSLLLLGATKGLEDRTLSLMKPAERMDLGRVYGNCGHHLISQLEEMSPRLSPDARALLVDDHRFITGGRDDFDEKINEANKQATSDPMPDISFDGTTMHERCSANGKVYYANDSSMTPMK